MYAKAAKSNQISGFFLTIKLFHTVPHISTINQYLNFEITAEAQCDSVGTALSAIIIKMIKNSGFPHNVYSHLIDSCLNSITDYGGSVIGFDQHESPPKIHSRAAPAFLSVRKNGVKCAIDWLLPKYRTRFSRIRQFLSMSRITDDRQTKKELNPINHRV